VGVEELHEVPGRLRLGANGAVRRHGVESADYAALAHRLGVPALRVEKASDIAPAIEAEIARL
jgi:thiamine pyrophosphate-dependent acetolactate synthase large subunit-like protein